MSVAPTTTTTRAPLLDRGAAGRAARTVGAIARRAPSAGGMARRRLLVRAAKIVLPVLALAILTVMVLWQDLIGDPTRARFSYRRGLLEAVSGQIADPRYRGIDERNRPYSVTASSATQHGPELFDLVEPKADVTLENGAWMMVTARNGVFVQHRNVVDLSGNVTIYRDDGTTLQTDAATVDLKAGAASSASMTHVEGPFGTLDAQGFAALDRGDVVQFPGPGHLLLNAAKH
ncbi:MAG: LPS export ABC transporter periplasmic protein LptC [Acidisphaera sp.]|nr:LPS export ABC transporter periplasmic protein LptC [Acidisphaera sp.]MBV9812726.1 LPS export ABC transporter periplasmic protein LptC [Acetobacteraceae bacterium]